jgi:prepilin-type N-terminal cleavage/methylation domain-containing protein
MAHRSLRGFTLLEMSIVLLIIATVAVGSMSIFTAAMQERRVDDTNAKMKTLQTALLNYRLAFNRIPCPADITAAIDTAAFGVEVGTPGDGNCTGANWGNYPPLGNNVGGMVPTKALRLPDDAAIDGWGRRIVYYVDPRFTANNAFTLIPPTDTTPRMNVMDLNNKFITNLAVYGLISEGTSLAFAGVHSPTGPSCAYSRNGTVVTLSTSDNNGAFENCALAGQSMYSGFPYQNSADPQDIFDQVVVWGTRSSLRSPTE